MEILKATRDHAEDIAKILVESYNIDDISEGVNAFISELNKNHFFIIAIEDGNVIGLSSWVVRGLPKHQLAELDRIAVLPEKRGMGVAIRLFEELKKDAHEYYKLRGNKLRKLFLQTHASNSRAQAFYKKMGFIEETRLKNHYYHEEDEVIFSMFF